jgi:hypothetical protein
MPMPRGMSRNSPGAQAVKTGETISPATCAAAFQAYRLHRSSGPATRSWQRASTVWRGALAISNASARTAGEGRPSQGHGAAGHRSTGTARRGRTMERAATRRKNRGTGVAPLAVGERSVEKKATRCVRHRPATREGGRGHRCRPYAPGLCATGEQHTDCLYQVCRKML